MAFKASLSLIFVVFTSIINISNAQICYKTGNFTTNSIYERNRDILLSSLASNVTANDGFLTATVGQGQDRVYGLALCLKDATPQACSSCVNSGIQGLKETCQIQKEALFWSGDPVCLIRYASRSLFGNLELKPSWQGYNVDNITSDMEQFDQVWTEFTDRLVSEASRGTFKRKYFAGDTNLTEYEKIYAVMTCTPDLSRSNCSNCLQAVVSEYKNCCLGHQGGFSQNPNCFFRWDLYPFVIPDGTAPGSSPINPIIGKKGVGSRTVVLIAVPAIIFVGLLGVCVAALVCRRKVKLEIMTAARETSQQFQLLGLGRSRHADRMQDTVIEEERPMDSQDYPLIELDIIKKATQHFSKENKLGEGGFGPVYKGTLEDGKEIAVKRLSRNSGQGLTELMNEVSLIARLQHRNLVRLVGCCLEKNENMLIYEYMPNRSLDMFLFDSSQAAQLDWQRRLSIVSGVARGLLYLHEDSRLKIIHRDLKVSNVLLDYEMNPKISDFGMARIFGGDQNKVNTNRVVGTYGYMSPEYAMEGLFSVKSDVFSFGVIVLEIISGKRNNGFYLSEQGESLLTYAWKMWSTGRGVELMDPLLTKSSDTAEVLKCIHIGLLCVQDNPSDRPSMSQVVVTLASDTITLPKPSQPTFSVGRVGPIPSKSSSDDKVCSVNQVTLSNVSPR